jgi:hypothetical protein
MRNGKGGLFPGIYLWHFGGVEGREIAVVAHRWPSEMRWNAAGAKRGTQIEVVGGIERKIAVGHKKWRKQLKRMAE